MRLLDKWSIYTVASLHENGDDNTADSFSVPWGVTGGSPRGSSKLWVGGVTADAETSDPDNPYLENKSQMIFAFAMPDIRTGHKTSRGEWAELSRDGNDGGLSADEAAKRSNGWYIPLEEDEYVTAKPLLYGGNLYAATFRENGGVSRLYAVPLESGRPVLWGGGKKYIEFKGIKFVSFTLSAKGEAHTLAASYRVLGDNVTIDTSGNALLSEVVSKDASSPFNAIVVKLAPAGGVRSVTQNNDDALNYWIYNARH